MAQTTSTQIQDLKPIMVPGLDKLKQWRTVKNVMKDQLQLASEILSYVNCDE
jgi:hypothetical protein